jgi:hypothetical protein
MLSQGEESAENKREMRKFFKNIGCAFLEPSNAESEIAEFFIQQKGTKLLKEFSKLLDPSTIISESESILVILKWVFVKYKSFSLNIYHLTALN